MSYPRFSDGEFARRNGRVRGFMADDALAALVVFGTSAQARTLQADIQYLSNFGGMRDNYLLFPLEGDPALLVQSANHVPNAREISVLAETRAGTGWTRRRRWRPSYGSVAWPRRAWAWLGTCPTSIT